MAEVTDRKTYERVAKAYVRGYLVGRAKGVAETLSRIPDEAVELYMDLSQS